MVYHGKDIFLFATYHNIHDCGYIDSITMTPEVRSYPAELQVRDW